MKDMVAQPDVTDYRVYFDTYEEAEGGCYESEDCRRAEGGFDLCASDCGFCVCENGHEFCESHFGMNLQRKGIQGSRL